METKIIPEKFEDVLAVALRHSKWLPRIGVDRDGGGKVSTPLLIPLTIATHEAFFAEIEKKWLSMMKQYNNEVVISRDGQSRSFKLYSLLWGRMCVTAYFFYHDDPFWKNTALPEMRSLNNVGLIQADIDIAMQRIDMYYEKLARLKLTNRLAAEQPAEPSAPADTSSSARIAELEQQLAQKDAEIEKLTARIKELETQLNGIHLSFIQTEGKMDKDIQWAYDDIKKAVKKPSTMAKCLRDLQHKRMLKGQEQYGDLKDIKSIYEELKETFHFTWTYPALCKALQKR